MVLHAQALLLTDAVTKTQQFIEQQRLQKKEKSRKAKERMQAQLDVLVRHQQRQQLQFTTMLQRQQDVMEQARAHVSPQQHQQQQTQFFMYRQLMDNLLRRSHEVGNVSAVPVAAAADNTTAAERLLLLQALMHQQKLDQMRGLVPAPGVGAAMSAAFGGCSAMAAPTGFPFANNAMTMGAALQRSGDAGASASSAALQGGQHVPASSCGGVVTPCASESASGACASADSAAQHGPVQALDFGTLFRMDAQQREQRMGALYQMAQMHQVGSNSQANDLQQGISTQSGMGASNAPPEPLQNSIPIDVALLSNALKVPSNKDLVQNETRARLQTQGGSSKRERHLAT